MRSFGGAMEKTPPQHIRLARAPMKPVFWILRNPSSILFFLSPLPPKIPFLCRVVKEEITKDSALLPCFNGRVVSWLVSSEVLPSEPPPPAPPALGEVCPEPSPPPPPPLPVEKSSGIGKSRPPSFQFPPQPKPLRQLRELGPRNRVHRVAAERAATAPGDHEARRFSSSTVQSSASCLLKCHCWRRKQHPPHLERTSSFSSITDSMSLNIITVTLNIVFGGAGGQQSTTKAPKG
ncbi:segment polarity protein dishevelled homolog DVL-2-like isoform X2 [Notechis scutatus]|uniref:Segment polarity protein dishevelled homolog DVL-2-like isoform X2 n=1 Tax=Notechis scutatus TaxID=8663 RepID=A0A6J1VYP3_9SAUR|nr:segment polarity protein dishevelled homolog DVL-2-like isoform X2 [Notechis scutatus]